MLRIDARYSDAISIAPGNQLARRSITHMFLIGRNRACIKPKAEPTAVLRSPQTMRLFTAVTLPQDVVTALTRLIDQLRPSARIRWSPASNLHITTKFIGEWPEERLGELRAALDSLPAREPIPIEVRGLGFFPNPHAPRVFWAAVHAGPELATLAQATSQALESLGVAAEKRPFSPHLTLARIKEPLPLATLQRAIASLPAADFGAFTADRFHLYLSQLNPGGSVYTKLSDYAFRK
jgi:2'-5' RNA ligase